MLHIRGLCLFIFIQDKITCDIVTIYSSIFFDYIACYGNIGIALNRITPVKHKYERNYAMKEKITENILDETADAICITTNSVIDRYGNAVMGAGIAKQAKLRYSSIEKVLASCLRKSGNHCNDLGIWDNKHIVSFPTKNHWKDGSSIELIKQSCKELTALADKNDWKNVLLPPVGCGCGGLDYENEVKPIISALLDDRFTICQRASDKHFNMKG